MASNSSDKNPDKRYREKYKKAETGITHQRESKAKKEPLEATALIGLQATGTVGGKQNISIVLIHQVCGNLS